jgi:hypothetical protein
MSAQDKNQDVRQQILKVLTNSKLDPNEQRTKVAKCVVEALSKLGRFYFHRDRADFSSAMFFDAGRKFLEFIRSDRFQAALSQWLGINRADQLFRYISAEVETAALRGPHTTGIIPEAFWAARPGAIYLSNGDGGVVKITATEILPCDNGIDGVVFATGRVLAPWRLTAPVDPFDRCALFRDVRCLASHGTDLLRLWMYSMPTIPGSKPPLCFVGDIGSGKTKLAKGIAELWGIPTVAAKVEERGEDSFWVNVNGGGLLILDNADSRTRWLPDALANATTDGCTERRKLYTDSEKVVLRARAWIGITTANPMFASDAGLADRLLVIRMGRRTGETKDEILSQEIAENRDGILSHIAQTLRSALADQGPIPGGLNARHPDFAAFAVRIGRALGRQGEAIAALQAAESDKSAFCLENDAFGVALTGYLREQPTFSDTANQLASRLNFWNTDSNSNPWTAKGVGKRLTLLWPHLEKVLTVAKRQTDRKGITTFTLKLG